MNCYFTCQKVSKFPKTCFTATKETTLAPFNLAHPVDMNRKAVHTPIEALGSAKVTRYVLARWRQRIPVIRLAFTDCL